MLFELLAVVVAGFAGAGVALIANKLLGRRAVRWLVPTAAGAAMLAMAISNEYGWYPRTARALPDGLEVAATAEGRAFYRPWTYAFPLVTRFLAVDLAGIRTNQAQAGQRIVDVYAFARWEPVRKRGVAVDCSGARRADLTPDISFGADGTIEGARWRRVGAGDPIVRTVCKDFSW